MDNDVFDACGRLNCSAHRNAMPAGGPWLSLAAYTTPYYGRAVESAQLRRAVNRLSCHGHCERANFPERNTSISYIVDVEYRTSGARCAPHAGLMAQVIPTFEGRKGTYMKRLSSRCAAYLSWGWSGIQALVDVLRWHVGSCPHNLGVDDRPVWKKYTHGQAMTWPVLADAPHSSGSQPCYSPWTYQLCTNLIMMGRPTCPSLMEVAHRRSSYPETGIDSTSRIGHGKRKILQRS